MFYRSKISRQKKNLAREKKIPVPEIPEVSAGTNTTLIKRFSAFPALRNRNYRIFFSGQFISVIGTWLQIVAQGWLVLQLTNSPFTIGLIAALATTPSLLFSLFGGVVVDRFNRKTILYLTQTANMVLALTLGTLTILDMVNLPVIGTIAFLMGTVNAIDAPARQAFVSTVVSKDQLASAIALNSGIFNAARAIGPAIAGILIASVGSGPAFILNGFSYLAVLVALRFVDHHETISANHLNPLQAIKEGIQYSFTHPLIRVLIIFTGVLSVFGWSYSTMIPVIAKTIYQLQAKGLGYMYTATGLGSLLATFLVGAYSRKISPTLFIIGGNVIFTLSLIVFSFSTSLYMALPLLFFIGMGLLCQAATMNTLIQTVVRNEFRGRVMSLYVLMFLGFAPLGNFEIGFISEHAGISFALALNAVIVLSFGLLVFTFRNKIRTAYTIYKKNHQT